MNGCAPLVGEFPLLGKVKAAHTRAATVVINDEPCREFALLRWCLDGECIVVLDQEFATNVVACQRWPWLKPLWRVNNWQAAATPV